jgi:serine/threonine protein kinase
MNNGNTLLSDLAASIADGAAIDWEQVKSSTTSPPELALLSEMQTIARISERRWSQLPDQPTRKAPVGVSAHRVAEGAVSPEAAIPFQRWGHLEILERIGVGGFGEVYRARDPKLEREVALKLLRGERAQASALSVKTHRLLRRGIPYDDGDHRGLLFMAYQTSIVDQFEHVMKEWAGNPNFSKKGTGADLLFGRVVGPKKFRINFKDKMVTLERPNKPWIVPTGGGYFFAPSIQALRETFSQ